MAAPKGSFYQRDLERGFKAAAAAGHRVLEYSIRPDGTLHFVTDAAEAISAKRNPCDRLLD